LTNIAAIVAGDVLPVVIFASTFALKIPRLNSNPYLISGILIFGKYLNVSSNAEIRSVTN
jgi:hypothetical protein